MMIRQGFHAIALNPQRVIPQLIQLANQSYSQSGSRKYNSRQHSRQMQRSSAARVTVATPERVSYAALDRLRYRVRYDGSYREIGYPNGDVPNNVGVCTDTVVFGLIVN